MRGYHKAGKLAAILAVLMITSAAGSVAPVGAATSRVVSAAGDIACDPASGYFKGGAGTGEYCRQYATSQLLDGSNAILALGDTQYEHSTLSNFRASYAMSWGRDQYKDRTHPAIGNHEYAAGLDCGPVSCRGPNGERPDPSGYWNYFGGRADGRLRGHDGPEGKGYYSFNVGDWHLIALNSMCWSVGGCGEGSPQERWLKNDLEQYRDKKCVLAYWHHPRFSSGQGPNYPYYVQWWKHLDEADAELVLVGHDHVYERFGRQDAWGNRDATAPMEFMVGTGGKNLGRFTSVEDNSKRRIREHGVLRLRLASNSFRWKFVGIDRRTLDSGDANCR
jgi:hypothetical protein